MATQGSNSLAQSRQAQKSILIFLHARLVANWNLLIFKKRKKTFAKTCRELSSRINFTLATSENSSTNWFESHVSFCAEFSHQTARYLYLRASSTFSALGDIVLGHVYDRFKSQSLFVEKIFSWIIRGAVKQTPHVGSRNNTLSSLFSILPTLNK